MKSRTKKILQGLITSNNLALTLVDVGARNGIFHLPDYAPFVTAYGFEPNPVEYQKLISGQTDAARVGILAPAHKKVSFFPYALSDHSGKAQFFSPPAAPGAAGMIEPETSWLGEFTYHGGRQCRKNFGEDLFTDVDVIEVESRTLDQVCQEEDIKNIDLLKIDVEGSEFDVLKGAQRILKHTGVIFVETCIVPFRKEQKLFGHLDILLREHNFDLVKHDIVQQQIGYKYLKRPTHYVPPFYHDPHGRPLSCDAIYINRDLTGNSRLLAQALVLLELECIDEGLFLLDRKVAHIDKAVVRALSNPAQFFSTGQNIRHNAYRIIDELVTLAGILVRGIQKGNK